MSPDDARRIGLAARRALSRRQRSTKSIIICRRIAATPAFRRARLVAAYLALDDEVDLHSLLIYAAATGRQICLPVVTSAGLMTFQKLNSRTLLRRHALGMLQPHQPLRYGNAPVHRACIDLICAPMSAFDDKNNRTGMGGGYYDRFLAGKNHLVRPSVIGVAFACQQVANITPAPWDIPVDQVVTESFPGQGARAARD